MNISDSPLPLLVSLSLSLFGVITIMEPGSSPFLSAAVISGPEISL